MFPDKMPVYAKGAEGIPCPDTTRYYNYVNVEWGGRFELYGQWELTEEDLEAEKNRIRTELSDFEMTERSVGQWTIWSYSWSDASMCIENPDTYVEMKESYSYLFFAYNEESGLVRYVSSYADYAEALPGFYSLDWN